MQIIDGSYEIFADFQSTGRLACFEDMFLSNEEKLNLAGRGLDSNS